MNAPLPTNESAAPASSLTVPPRQRRRLKWILLAISMSALLVALLIARAYERQHRIERLDAALMNAGGEMILPLPIWEYAWQRWWVGQSVVNWTGVSFDKSTIDGAWLRAHDNLRDVSINSLVIYDNGLTGPEVAELVSAHPLGQFMAWSVPNMDAVAAALGRVPTLNVLDVAQSDLTDEGFRQLPLEHLNSLDVDGTRVTSSGLRELRRCAKLRSLQLGGKQLDAEVVDVLSELPHLKGLTLSGNGVTDDDLRLLHEATLLYVRLWQTSVTNEGVDLLRAASPNCRVDVQQ